MAMLGMGTGSQAWHGRQNSPPWLPPAHQPARLTPEAPVSLAQRLAEVKPHRLSKLSGKVWDPLGMMRPTSMGTGR